MSEVGVVSIAFGVLVVCSRGALLVAPAATLRWLGSVVGSNGPIRALGVFALLLGAVLVWAGASEHSTLATILSVFGGILLGIGAPLLLLFPGAYRALVEALLPVEPEPDLSGWRVLGLVSVVIGALMIYFGALAL